MGQGKRYACASLVTTPGYVLGARVLGHSIRRSGWRHELLMLVTPEIDSAARRDLARVWDRVVEVEPIANPNPPAAQGLDTFATTYTKLQVWGQTEYSKLVFIDADAIVLGDLSELVRRPSFAAAPCASIPDMFNSGVMVLHPSRQVLRDMLSKVDVLPSYDGADQGFLNAYFADWFTGPTERRLPMIYNVPRMLAIYAPAWNRVKDDLRVLHFHGPRKPWVKQSRFARFVSRTMLRLTGVRFPDPSPRDYWWEMYHDMQAMREPPQIAGSIPRAAGTQPPLRRAG